MRMKLMLNECLEIRWKAPEFCALDFSFLIHLLRELVSRLRVISPFLLLFFIFSEGSKCTRARANTSKQSREMRRAFPVSRLQSRVWSLSCLARFTRRVKRKGRPRVIKVISNVWFHLKLKHLEVRKKITTSACCTVYCGLITWLAQLGGRRPAELRVEGSNPGRTNTQGL